MTDNVNEEPVEELEPDVDDDLDDSISPNLGKVTEQEVPDYDPDAEFEGEDGEYADN